MSLKSTLASLLRTSRLATPLRRRLRGFGVMLLLHQINDGNPSGLDDGNSAEFLGDVVDWLRRQGWETVRLAEALQRLQGGVPERPFLVLTFDDGYRDTLRRALPVLERLEAPFTVYVPTGAVTRELYAWWLALRALVMSRDEVTIECMGHRFSCVGLAEKIAAYRSIDAWVHHDYRRKFDLAPTFAAYGISLRALADEHFMDADELRGLARHPLATIGAHTTTHAALSTLAPEAVRAEMTDNRAYLEGLLDSHVTHFAYPYGDPRSCGPRDAIIAREAGFSSAVMVAANPIFADHRRQMHSLPRIAVRPHETLDTLYYRVSGLSWAMNAHKRGRSENA